MISAKNTISRSGTKETKPSGPKVPVCSENSESVFRFERITTVQDLRWMNAQRTWTWSWAFEWFIVRISKIKGSNCQVQWSRSPYATSNFHWEFILRTEQSFMNIFSTRFPKNSPSPTSKHTVFNALSNYASLCSVRFLEIPQSLNNLNAVQVQELKTLHLNLFQQRH